ncbi:glycosyltransferase [Anaerotruncus sp. X29]|nr:glycosyltransferase [Anaerotruncus sp. X29]
MDIVSLVVPCYNEEKALPFFYKEIYKIAAQMQGFQFEMIFVDDGSKDRTLEICKELKLLDERVHYLSFSRNFGKEAALYAGLKAATGNYIAVMDADLQDPPELLKDMLSILQNEEQIDCVATRRTTRRGEPPIRSFFAKSFYKLINKISKAEIMDGARDFRMMTRQVVDAVLSMGEYNRFSKGIFGWIGFRTKWLDYVNVERVAGETKWSFWKLFLYAIDGIIAFSTMPLVIASLSGILFCITAILMAVYFAVKTVLYGDPVAGFPTLICLILLIGGIQLFCIGILGQYLSKTYLEAKKRPIYIVKETDRMEGQN